MTQRRAAPRHGPSFNGDGTVTFRVWAPNATTVDLVLGDERQRMLSEDLGWHTATATAADGDRYGFSLDGGDVRPDPASRHQPDGVHERSALVDPSGFRWGRQEATWRAAPLSSAVIYELHVGTFTSEGTFDAALEHLAHLADLGVTHVEVLPLNAFNGTHGWGYDGVAWYAVHEPYGGPQGFARFVDACHRAGLAVVVDVVLNHLGPSGNYLPEFGPYLTERYRTPWGDGLNLDGPASDEVRAFMIGAALGWFEQYHVDALRLDAVHALIDMSEVHILSELSAATAAAAVRLGRPLQLIAETERNDPLDLTPVAFGGRGLDGQWADDLHHAIHTAVTGEDEGYYADYLGLEDVAVAYQRGFVYDGRYSAHRGRTVGAPLGGVPAWHLVGHIQNHDQVGNRALGERLTTIVDADLVRVAVVLLCAAPLTPMLFMGEEYGETNPFQYFTSHPEPELAEAVRSGRAEEFAAFSAFANTEVPDPQSTETFERSRLDWSRASSPDGTARLALWRTLLRLRRDEPALGNGRHDLVDVATVSGEELVVVRRDPGGSEILLGVNLGGGPVVLPAPRGGGWVRLLDSGDVRFGGPGASAQVTTLAGKEVVELPPRVAVLWRRQP